MAGNEDDLNKEIQRIKEEHTFQYDKHDVRVIPIHSNIIGKLHENGSSMLSQLTSECEGGKSKNNSAYMRAKHSKKQNSGYDTWVVGEIEKIEEEDNDLEKDLNELEILQEADIINHAIDTGEGFNGIQDLKVIPKKATKKSKQGRAKKKRTISSSIDLNFMKPNNHSSDSNNGNPKMKKSKERIGNYKMSKVKSLMDLHPKGEIQIKKLIPIMDKKYFTTHNLKELSEINKEINDEEAAKLSSRAHDYQFSKTEQLLSRRKNSKNLVTPKFKEFNLSLNKTPKTEANCKSNQSNHKKTSTNDIKYKNIKTTDNKHLSQALSKQNNRAMSCSPSLARTSKEELKLSTKVFPALEAIASVPEHEFDTKKSHIKHATKSRLSSKRKQHSVKSPEALSSRMEKYENQSLHNNNGNNIGSRTKQRERDLNEMFKQNQNQENNPLKRSMMRSLNLDGEHINSEQSVRTFDKSYSMSFIQKDLEEESIKSIADLESFVKNKYINQNQNQNHAQFDAKERERLARLDISPISFINEPIEEPEQHTHKNSFNF